MATITAPNDINNNSDNAGVDLDTNFEILYGNDQALNNELGTVSTVANFTKIQTGTGHAPAGTPVKMSWFEGTTNGSGESVVAHGLGSNILMILGAAFTSGSNYTIVFYGNLLGTDIAGNINYDNTNITYRNSTISSSQTVRFLVWHK